MFNMNDLNLDFKTLQAGVMIDSKMINPRMDKIIGRFAQI